MNIRLIFSATLLYLPQAGQAQQLPGPQNQPAQQRLVLPPLPPLIESEENNAVLPPIVLPPTSSTERLAAGNKIEVRAFRITGSTVLSTNDLDSLTAPYRGRELSFFELTELRESLTRAYIERGFVNSGAVIPAQTINDGVVTIRIIEGRLADIEYQTDGRFQATTIMRRVRRGLIDPLNVNQLERQLQLLQQDDRIQRVHAALVPTDEPGASRLRLQLIERRPVRVVLQFDNYESPAVGAEAGRIQVAHTNVTGYGDRLEAGYDRTRGLQSLMSRYQVPLAMHDMQLDVKARHSKSEVIESPFDRLDIVSTSTSYGLVLHYPLKNTIMHTSSLSATTEYRRSKSFLLGEPFSFGLGTEEGVSKVAVLRLGYDWSYRDREQACAMRAVVNRGLDTLDSTIHADNTPDSRFTSVLLQAQWARRLPRWDAQVLARGDAQLTNSPLLGLEQFAIGGHATVRGYRESTLVRDQGWVASLEMRVPLLRDNTNLPGVEIGWFVDGGRAWNRQRESGEEQSLLSAGLSGRWNVNRSVDLQIDWAKPLRNRPDSISHDLQDEGVHLRLSAAYE